MQAPRTRGALSPAAQLLRSSRLFSIPNALPKPPSQGSVEDDRGSSPYPLQQAITTPPSSLARGDWGLKRPLPLRTTTRTSTPALRISSIDTIEHITDFESAADHVQTFKKWQELNLSISNEASYRPVIGKAFQPRSNAFESFSDITTPAPSKAVGGSQSNLKWKYSGPDIDLISEDAFKRYVSQLAKEKKDEFSRFLKREIRERHISEMKRQARDSGEDFDITAAEPTEQDYKDGVQKLRDSFINEHNREMDRWNMGELQGGNSELAVLMSQFLDLPPLNPPDGGKNDWNFKFQDENLARDEGPSRTTHPSAGLSYLRSHAYLENHPVLGPQAHRTPVEGRILKPRTGGGKTSPKATLGVGGFVTYEGDTSHFTNARNNAEDNIGLTRLNYQKEGGSKVWVSPEIAGISREGRLRLLAFHANPNAIKIKNGEVPQDITSVRELSGRYAGSSSRQSRPNHASSQRGRGSYGIENRSGGATGRLLDDLAASIRKGVPS